MNPPIPATQLSTISDKYKKDKNIQVRVMRTKSLLTEGDQVTDMSVEEEERRWVESVEIEKALKEMKDWDDKGIMDRLWNHMDENGQTLWSKEELMSTIVGVWENAIRVVLTDSPREVKISPSDMPKKFQVLQKDMGPKVNREAFKVGEMVKIKLKWDQRGWTVRGMITSPEEREKEKAEKAAAAA